VSDDVPRVKLANVLHPVADVAAATAFYQETLGLTLKFADGDRYAALDAGTTTLALAGPAEDIAGVPAASFKVPDVATALDAITRAGGTILRPAEQGPHEIRAVVRDPWGNTMVVYAPK
jgi:predicted enzyme related to lactoylglutathione lyase